MRPASLAGRFSIWYFGTVKFGELIKLAQGASQHLNRPWDNRLEVILQFCWQSPDQKAFPKMRGREFKSNPADYLKLYIQSYFSAREEVLNLQEVGTVADPAVDVILRAFSGLEDLSAVSKHHRQSMAAENLLGALLERYIAEYLEPKGWVWCAGNTARSVDFLYHDLSLALQIKNRSNSENSSSAAIRQGTDIKKWFRINANNERTNWENFPNAEGLSEEGFYGYIENYAKRLK